MEGRATGVPGTVRTILYVALLLPGACGRPAGARTAVVVPPQDTSAAFAGSMNAVRRARPGRHPAILRAVRLAPHAAYDRVVFEFAGDSAPGYEVEYADRPLRVRRYRVAHGRRAPGGTVRARSDARRTRQSDRRAARVDSAAARRQRYQARMRL